jgi:hypothetical protein
MYCGVFENDIIVFKMIFFYFLKNYSDITYQNDLLTLKIINLK